MLNFIDRQLNKITMYRLVLYYLLLLLVGALIFSCFGMLHFRPLDLIFSTLILVAICWFVNKIFAKVFNIPANIESIYITALILALIITPPDVKSVAYFAGLMFLFWAAVWSMAVKYMFAIYGKHFFNPAAFAVALTAITINQSASWWVGTLVMLPLVIVGGVLMVRKIQRFNLVLSFLIVAIFSIILFSPTKLNYLTTLNRILIDSPLFFFAFIMLTEPLTTPPTKNLQMLYGAITGLVFSPMVHIGSIYSTPELALLVGNIFSYIVSPKTKYLLTLVSKERFGNDIVDFVFEPNQRVSFQPGQYWEWTLELDKLDSRGNRRYFTIASSPTESQIHLGVKFYDQPSSFKDVLLKMQPGSKILAGQLAGDFTLPNNRDKKLVFIAGGIGITPFRSMLKYLIDMNEKRTVTLFYSNKNFSEICYQEIFTLAENRLGIKTVLTLTDQKNIPADWLGYRGYINSDMISKEVPDYQNSFYYISGPHGMVVTFVKVLHDIGIPKNQIKIDFFPGFV